MVRMSDPGCFKRICLARLTQERLPCCGKLLWGLKTEQLFEFDFAREEAKRDMLDYIEMFYNSR